MLHLDSERRAKGDAGATLIEILVALSILSIAGVAILAGLQLTVKSSDINRKQVQGGAYVRTYAEAIQRYVDTNGNYARCTASTSAYAPNVVGFTPPSGYTGTHSAPEFLNGDGSLRSGACPGRDAGIQRLRLTVASDDGRARERLTVIIRRSCGEGTSCD